MSRRALFRPRRRVSRNAGSYRGTLSGWHPPISISGQTVSAERELSSLRAEDLTSNDWAGRSMVSSFADNVVGFGLNPQSRLNAERLGISHDDAAKLQTDMELCFSRWCREADARGQQHFQDMQYLACLSVVRRGEFISLPLMLDRPGRKYSLTIQAVNPSRLSTPSDMTSRTDVIDGIELDDLGAPVAYWIENARPERSGLFGFAAGASGSRDYVRQVARIAHRPGVFHCFTASDEEQVRGESMLGPAANLFRHSADSFEFELMAQILQASMPIFISTRDPQSAAGFGAIRPPQGTAVQPAAPMGSSAPPSRHRAVRPGQILYGNANEVPTMLQGNHPSSNFMPFQELVIRAMAASMGMPYEVLLKDFSKTNYSSARAALLEAWRVFMRLRKWMVRHYCQPVYAMVIEEAFLRGYWTRPAGAPDFYDAVDLYTATEWVGPKRGYIDPVKETVANLKAIEGGIGTYADAIAENGGDWETSFAQQALEKQRRLELGIAPENTAATKESA